MLARSISLGYQKKNQFNEKFWVYYLGTYGHLNDGTPLGLLFRNWLLA